MKSNSSGSSPLKNIEKLIDLFRKYGGIFENMMLDYSDERGFYCRTLDSNNESVISWPPFHCCSVKLY